jgi:dienelactone hydrolase
MRLVPLICLVAPVLLAADLRNTRTPNTDTPASLAAPASRQQWEARKAFLRTQILNAAGLLPMPSKTPLNPLVTGRIDAGEYTIERVALETRPGYWLGGNLYRPKGKPGRHPAILHPHGHWNYGRLEHQPLYSAQTLAANLARHGMVVYMYDMVGYNDTAQTPHDFSTPEYQLWGFTPLGLQLWNSIRVLDYLASLPDVDPARIAATGASGGGSQVFLLAAVDDRLALSAPVNMVSGIMQGGCICENAPGLRIGTNNIETAAMMAPKPMLLVAATGDWTRNVPRDEYPAIRRVYELYDKAAMVEAVQFDAPHNYHKESREAVYEFLRKHLTPETPPWKERNTNIEKIQDMMVWQQTPMPAHALKFDQVFAEWKAESKALSQKATAAELRERLRAVFGIESAGAELDSAVPSRWVEGRGPAVLAVHPDGMDAAAKLVPPGRAALLIDVFQTASAKAPRDRSHKHFLTFNFSDDVARVQDISNAVQYLQAKEKAPVEVLAAGQARWWALFGAAVSAGPVRFTHGPAEFDGSDAALQGNLFAPGLQRAGGVNSALRLLAGR